MAARRSRPARRAVGNVAAWTAAACASALLAVMLFSSGAHAQLAPECNDGIDNDGDGQIDGLKTGGNPNAETNIGGGNPFGGVRGFVNANAAAFGYSIIPNHAAVHLNSALKVCQIAGYTTVTSSSCIAPQYENRCGYVSFGDNGMYTWNGSNFVPINDNRWLSSVNCRGIPAACADGKDNDGDGLIDFPRDPGCASADDASEVQHDADCSSITDPVEGLSECKDGIDNDGDGKIDFAGGDPGCVDGDDNDERDPPAQCPAAYPDCGRDIPGGAVDICAKAGKFLRWSPGAETCTVPTGERGICSVCADTPCPSGYSCMSRLATCDKEHKLVRSPGSETCILPDTTVGLCSTCESLVDDDDDNDNDDEDDPPPLCPVGCKADADCGAQEKCTMDQNDPTKPACFQHNGACVKKCLVPKCVNNKCTMTTPPDDPVTGPYLACEGENACPPPRCGDGIVQADPNPQEPGGEKQGGASPQCDKGYRLANGQFTTIKPIGCFSIVLAADGICNCIMAAAPGSTPIAPVASLLRGSSLLATSISNACGEGPGYACTSAFVQANCNPGDACFALLGARTVQQQCAPANCAGHEEECGMADVRWGSVPLTWEMCAGTAQPPKDPEGPEDPPVAVPEGGEECDDGNNLAGDGCNPVCKIERCGDGVVQQKGADGKEGTADDEQCDDGNTNVGDGCGNTCKLETCGNGKQEWGEECDDGIKNSDTEPGACRTNCMMPKCNDGVVDALAPWGEQCDCGDEGKNFDWEANKDDPMSPYCETEVDGKPAICHIGMCRVFYCGDGFVFNAGHDRESGTADDEMCDNGPYNSDFPTGSGKCETSAQCESGACVDNVCTSKSCSKDADCGDGKCMNNVCVAGGCTQNSDCPITNPYGFDDRECVSGSCRACNDNTQCASGFCAPNGLCAAKPAKAFDATCRMDCKPVRCGDGIKDAGETCDEGEKMMKCGGYPQPACDCAIPSWGSHTRPTGAPYNETCCPPDRGRCEIWGTSTCPSGCGVKGPVGGKCSDGVLLATEECDTHADNPLGDHQYVYRPNRDGDRLSFIEDDGRWKATPASIEKKYTTIDHEPAENASEDRAWIVSGGAGTARTYFHLWDVTMAFGVFHTAELSFSADFDGDGTEWKKHTVFLPLTGSGLPPSPTITLADMNAAIVEIVADEDAHTLTFRLHHPGTGVPLSAPVTVASPIAVAGRKPIAIDALKIVVRGKDTDVTACKGDCKVRRCGNGGAPEPGEECDDGNTESGDGCNNACRLEFCPVR